MISVDGSIIAAIIIFVLLVFSLDRLLFRPLLQVMNERKARTSGTIAEANRRMQHYAELFERYQNAIKEARAEGYRIQEQARSEGVKKRSAMLEAARAGAEGLIRESRENIRDQVEAAKAQLEREAQEMARTIAAAILKRPA